MVIKNNFLNFRNFIFYSENLYTIAISEKAKGDNRQYLIASILLSWMSLESFINDIMYDFSCVNKDTFSIHERGFLLEKKVNFQVKGLKAGNYIITNEDEYHRLEEKILFLLYRFGDAVDLNKGNKNWQNFNKLKRIRDSLSHPKKMHEVAINETCAKESINISKYFISLIHEKVYKKIIKW